MPLKAYRVSFKPCPFLLKVLNYGEFIGYKLNNESLHLLIKLKESKQNLNKPNHIKLFRNNRSKYLIMECSYNCPIKYFIRNNYINRLIMTKKNINLYIISNGNIKMKDILFNNGVCLINIERMNIKDLLISDNESEFLKEVIELGYLDYPKKITIRDLANRLKKSRTGTMIMVRRIFKKLVRTVV